MPFLLIMEIKSIVLHQIKREDNQTPSLNLSDHLLPNTDETVIDFVKSLVKSFSAKSPTYGVFHEEANVYPFQTLVGEYLSHNNFLDFSTQAMNHLSKEIQVPQAKGGYVVFVHYVQNSMDLLITIMLDKSEQFSVNDESLDIRKLLTLNIDRLARANRLNITKWQSGDELYLAFIKGIRDVSGFFQKFIGNTDLTSSKVNSTNLKNALGKYMRDNSFDDERKELVNRNVGDYIGRQYELESDILLESVSAFIDQENPRAFVDYIEQQEDLAVSGSFRITKKAHFDFFHKSVVAGNGFKLEFEKNLIKQGKIERIGNDVIIRDLPEDMLDIEFNTRNG